MAKSRSPKYRKQSRPGQADQAFVEVNGKRVYLGRCNTPESRQRNHRLLADRESLGEVQCGILQHFIARDWLM